MRVSALCSVTLVGDKRRAVSATSADTSMSALVKGSAA